MKIRYSAPFDVMDSRIVPDQATGGLVDVSETIADPERLRSLDGVHDTGDESMLDYLEDMPGFADMTGRIQAGPFHISYDSEVNRLRYVTEYEVDGALTDDQLEQLRLHTLSMWQEGIGVAFAQLVLTDEHDVVVDGDHRVGEADLRVEVTP